MILNPQVASVRMTCAACPEQYEGQLTDGRWFYFRYRFGQASLAAGADHDAVMGRQDVRLAVGDDLQGVFETTEERDTTFALLLRRIGGW